MLRKSTLVIGIIGIVFASAFFSLGFGLVFLLNKARIGLIGITAIGILFDMYALSNQLISSTIGIVRIIISVCIIGYLLTPKVKKLFV